MIFFLILFFSQIGLAENVTFDLDDGEKTTVYGVPGFDYYSCTAENGCDSKNDPVAWPDKNSKVELILDKNRQPTTTRVDGRPGEWFKVRTSYETKFGRKSVEGWVEGSYLNIPKPKAKPKPKKPICKDSAQDLKDIGEDILEGAKTAYEKQVAEVTKKLSPFVGQCVIGDDLPLTKPKKNWSADQPLYDQAILPTMQKHPEVVNLGLRQVSKNQLIEIDMLARTIYAEMAKCGHNHPEYLDVVARVALNRAEFDKNFRSEKNSPSEFSNEARRYDLDHRKNETPLMSVLTSSRKFNPWDMYLKKGVFNGSGVSQALCPPSSGDVFWGSYARGNGNKVPSFEKNVWNKILKVATETVLFQDQFKQRTRSLSDILLFQTQIEKNQNMSRFQNRPQVFRKINGEVISNNYCAAIYSAADWQKKYLTKNLAKY